MESFKLGGYAYDAIRRGAKSCDWVKDISVFGLPQRCAVEIMASLDGGVDMGSGRLE